MLLSVFSQSLSNMKKNKKITNYFLSEHKGMLIIKSDTKNNLSTYKRAGNG